MGFGFWLGGGWGEGGEERGRGEGGKERRWKRRWKWKGCIVGLDEGKGGMVVGLVDEVGEVREMVDGGIFRRGGRGGDIDVFLNK